MLFRNVKDVFAQLVSVQSISNMMLGVPMKVLFSTTATPPLRKLNDVASPERQKSERYWL